MLRSVGGALTNTIAFQVFVFIMAVKSFIELIPDMKMFLLVSWNKKRISLAREHKLKGKAQYI